MDQHLYDKLTPKELECVRLVARDRSSKEIARELGRSGHTVDNQIKSALGKLGLSSRYELARLVAEHEGRDQTLASSTPIIQNEPDQPLVPDQPADEGDRRLREEAVPFHGFPLDHERLDGRLTNLDVLVRVALLAVVLLILLLGSLALLTSTQGLANIIQTPR
jgi:DNA-binding CsgD family transcriptional regulator